MEEPQDNPYVRDPLLDFDPVEELDETAAREHFDLYPESGYESQTVTCVENTRDIDVAATVEAVSEEYDMVFSSGYGDISEASFRIGHMGEHDVESIRTLTDAIEDVAGL